MCIKKSVLYTVLVSQPQTHTHSWPMMIHLGWNWQYKSAKNLRWKLNLVYVHHILKDERPDAITHSMKAVFIFCCFYFFFANIFSVTLNVNENNPYQDSCVDMSNAHVTCSTTVLNKLAANWRKMVSAISNNWESLLINICSSICDVTTPVHTAQKVLFLQKGLLQIWLPNIYSCYRLACWCHVNIGNTDTHKHIKPCASGYRPYRIQVLFDTSI